MKYYSEKTKKLYDSAEEVEKAELAIVDKKKAREARAKEVEDALSEVAAASDKASDLLSKFCEDYGAFHTTIKDDFDPFSWMRKVFGLM